MGRNARFEILRSALPILMCLASAGLALLIGEWAVLFWISLWPLDAILARLQTAGVRHRQRSGEGEMTADGR